jgi:hypothetical protein
MVADGISAIDPAISDAVLINATETMQSAFSTMSLLEPVAAAT